jgi:hypothetical protein
MITRIDLCVNPYFLEYIIMEKNLKRTYVITHVI